MKGIILAAGKGSRLKELNLAHKSLAVIQKKHIIDFSLDLLVNTNNLVNEIIIVVGYHADEIINYVGDNYKGIPVRYVNQTELKGVAHAMLISKDVIDDDVIMCLADEILFNTRLPEMINEFQTNKLNCICGVIHDATDQSGKPIGYEVDDNNNVISVHEKPKSYFNDIRGIGECIFSKQALEELITLKPNPIRGELEMGDWIQSITDNLGKVKIFSLADAYINVNYKEDIEMAANMINKFN